jgi:hypothetical protein
MSISDTTISTDVFTSIRNKLVAAAPYITNSSTSATTTARIDAVFSDRSNSIPQIVIEPIISDEGEWKFGSSEGKKLINITITSYYKNSLGVDQLYDQISAALKANDINGISLVGITTDYSFGEVNDKKFHSKLATFTYDRE